MSKQRKDMLPWLDSRAEGASWAEIVEWAGPDGHRAIHSVLQRARVAGLVAFVGNSSRHGRWHTLRHAQAAAAAFARNRAAHIEERRIVREQYDRDRSLLRAERLREQRAAIGMPAKAVRMPTIGTFIAQALAWAEQPPEHRVVSAADAPRIAKRGPASVWELAA